MNVASGSDAVYEGEYAGHPYTVLVFPTETGGVRRGKRQVRLRIRYGGHTEDGVEWVHRSHNEARTDLKEPFIHTIARRLIAERWATEP